MESIYQDNTDDMEIVVVDNDSKDDSENVIKNTFPLVRYVQMGYNSGFARANNAGIKASQGDIVLLLNPDTLNIDNCVYSCFNRLEKDNHIACGVQLLNADGSYQISGNYYMTGGLNYMMMLPIIGNIMRNIAVSLKMKKTNVPKAEGTVRVDWVNGAFLMVKKSAIDKAGLFDEDFFLYSEEIEWCNRLGKVGSMCIYGDLTLFHLEGGSSSQAFVSDTKGYQNLYDKKGYQILVSYFLWLRKQHGIFWYITHLSLHIFAIIIYLVVNVLTTIVKPLNKAGWKRWWGYATNVIRSLQYFFSIITGRHRLYRVL